MNIAFLVDKRDIEFVLFEQIQIEELLKIPYYSDHSKETFLEMLGTAINMCQQKIAPLNKLGDKVGCKHNPETHEVTTPAGTKECYKEYIENGFLTLSSSQDAQGLQAPFSFNVALMEIFSCASPAFMMYPGLTRSCSNVLYRFGNDFMKKTVVPKLSSGEWTGTMCLTESSAGSAVGDLKSSAKRNGETFLIKGTKQWISGGEHDLAENIMHLVLARIEGAPQGIEGVSLFLVPKKKFDKQTGKIIGNNDMYCASIEEKLGLHGSTTCVLQFGDKEACEGYLIGEENHGIQYMFLMMNESRIGVGVQSLSLCSNAYLHAEKYAKERIQGVDSTQKRNSNPPRIAIIEHPDVRRLLLRQKSIAEGTRSLCYTLGKYYDLSEQATDLNLKKQSHDFLEFLTPIVKAWSSDMGFESITDSLQVFGGYGYTKDYPAEQMLRDMKITSIYEGTNGIQALDFVGRKMRMQDGMIYMSWLEIFTNIIEQNSQNPQVTKECEALSEHIALLVEGAIAMQDIAKNGEPKRAVLNAYPYMMAFGHVSVAGLLLEQALIALKSLENKNLSKADERFYRNKILTAKFFIHNVLPEAKSFIACITAHDNSALAFDF
ncbi:MAG: acyl-CoA dehydrogenase [Silvanigrellaceae bacterium]|nr:acyl-CoA dehydrogenase [Silvanigrellaceae bacterium]